LAQSPRNRAASTAGHRRAALVASARHVIVVMAINEGLPLYLVHRP
jgi:hypothetical protein